MFPNTGNLTLMKQRMVYQLLIARLGKIGHRHVESTVRTTVVIVGGIPDCNTGKFWRLFLAFDPDLTSRESGGDAAVRY